MKPWYGWLLCAAAVLGPSGCDTPAVRSSRGLTESHVSNENFLKIETGMTYQDVRAMLGPAFDDKRTQTPGYVLWVDGTKQIRVNFNAQDRVTGKSRVGL